LGIPLLFTEEFEVVIMIEVGSKRCMGRIDISDLKRITSEPWLVWQNLSTRAKWRFFISAWSGVEKKYLTRTGVVREAIYQ
jgi:hypothetical protein